LAEFVDSVAFAELFAFAESAGWLDVVAASFACNRAMRRERAAVAFASNAEWLPAAFPRRAAASRFSASSSRKEAAREIIAMHRPVRDVLAQAPGQRRCAQREAVPAERSMPPATITKVMPSAATATDACLHRHRAEIERRGEGAVREPAVGGRETDRPPPARAAVPRHRTLAEPPFATVDAARTEESFAARNLVAPECSAVHVSVLSVSAKGTARFSVKGYRDPPLAVVLCAYRRTP
jgi:hypothetical protein